MLKYDDDIDDEEPSDLVTDWKNNKLRQNNRWKEPDPEPNPDPDVPKTNLRRSTRDTVRPDSYNESGRRVQFNNVNLAQLEQDHNITPEQFLQTLEYSEVEGAVLAHLIYQFSQLPNDTEVQFGPRYH